jgi:hypothetical protein
VETFASVVRSLVPDVVSSDEVARIVMPSPLISALTSSPVISSVTTIVLASSVPRGFSPHIGSGFATGTVYRLAIRPERQCPALPAQQAIAPASAETRSGANDAKNDNVRHAATTARVETFASETLLALFCLGRNMRTYL